MFGWDINVPARDVDLMFDPCFFGTINCSCQSHNDKLNDDHVIAEGRILVVPWNVERQMTAVESDKQGARLAEGLLTCEDFDGICEIIHSSYIRLVLEHMFLECPNTHTHIHIKCYQGEVIMRRSEGRDKQRLHWD